MALGTLRDHLLTIEPNTETHSSTLLIYFLYGVALVNNLNDELVKIIQIHCLVAVPGADLSILRMVSNGAVNRDSILLNPISLTRL